MYEVTYSINGVIKKIMINADDSIQATAVFTNMYATDSNVQIINVARR